MADQKISALTALTGANVDDANDELAIVDDSAGQTKKITRAQLMKSVASISTDSINIKGSVYTSFSGGAIGGLFTGSTFGGLIEGATDGHLVVGIRENGSDDSFSIVSGGGNYDTDSVYDTVVASFRAGGNVGIGTSIPSQALDVVGNIAVSGSVDGRDVASDGTKLDGIETNADVTDTANVTAAGAFMDSEATNLAALKAINQGLATTDSVSFSSANIGSIKHSDFSGGAIGGLVTGTTFGGLIEGATNGHLVVGIRENNVQDSFTIVSGGGNYDTDSVYDTVVASFHAGGNVGIGTANPGNKLAVAGSIGVTGTLSLDGAVSWGKAVTVADDAVATITPPFNGGEILVTAESSSSFPQSAESILGFFDVGSSASFVSVHTGSNVDVLTNDQDLTTTAGTDGRVTISIRDNGTIQLNNRDGAARVFDFHLRGTTTIS